jgi:cytochrome c oxidase assembly protein subunit 15
MACVLIAMLRLLSAGRPSPSAVLAIRRRALTWVLGLAMVSCWVQLVIGALVAGSRNDQGFNHWPLFAGPGLWEEPLGLAWNLLDNAELHQWAHGWWAYALTAMLIAGYVLGWRASLAGISGPRMRLALQVSATFLVIQLMLGIANALLGISAQLALAHQVMGMCLFLSVVLAWYDARHEAEAASAATTANTAKGVTA